jgi:hypothetical protein
MGVIIFTGCFVLSCRQRLMICRQRPQRQKSDCCFYCYFWCCLRCVVFLVNAPTFIDCRRPPFSVSIRQLPTTASATDPLVWHKFPATSWWSDLPPLPNLLVNYPSLERERGRCGVGHRGVVVADHSVSATYTRPLRAGSHRHCYGC